MIQFSKQKTNKKDDDDIPLTEYWKRNCSKSINIKYDERGKYAHKQDPLYVPEDDLNIDDELVAATICEHKGCTKLGCQSPLCYSNFLDYPCKNYCMTHETENYTTVNVYEKKQYASHAKDVVQPEHFTVDGMPMMSPVKRRKMSEKEKNRQLCKKYRYSGELYISVQSGKEMLAREVLKNRCPAKLCGKRGLFCDQVTVVRRVWFPRPYNPPANLGGHIRPNGSHAGPTHHEHG